MDRTTKLSQKEIEEYLAVLFKQDKKNDLKVDVSCPNGHWYDLVSNGGMCPACKQMGEAGRIYIDALEEGLKAALQDALLTKTTEVVTISEKDKLDLLLKNDFLLAVEKADWEKIHKFLRLHKVEVLFMGDQQFHCFIDYQEFAENDRAFAVDLDPFSALLNGINNHIKIKSNNETI